MLARDRSRRQLARTDGSSAHQSKAKHKTSAGSYCEEKFDHASTSTSHARIDTHHCFSPHSTKCAVAALSNRAARGRALRLVAKLRLSLQSISLEGIALTCPSLSARQSMHAWSVTVSLAVVALGWAACGHSTLLSPTPRNSGANEKTYPCGYNYVRMWFLDNGCDGRLAHQRIRGIVVAVFVDVSRSCPTSTAQRQSRPLRLAC